MVGRHGQAVQVCQRFPIYGFKRFSIFSKSQAVDVRGHGRFLLFQKPDQLQKAVLPFTPDHIVDLREMGQKMFPEKGGPHAAENHGCVWIDLFDHAGDVDAAPAVGMQDRKTDHIRLLVAQQLIDAVGGFSQVVAVENVHRIAVGPKHGPHGVKPHGDGADIILVDAFVEKIRVDEQYFHNAGGNGHRMLKLR